MFQGESLANADSIRERIKDEKLARLFDYWREASPPEGLPSRDIVDPFAFKFLLGNIFLVDVEGDPPRFRYRLFGDRLAERAGYELTGRYVDDIPSTDMREVLVEAYGELFRGRVPVVRRGRRFNDDRIQGYEFLLLPLSSDGSVIDLILGAMLYDG